jgi:hypothetical protein
MMALIGDGMLVRFCGPSRFVHVINVIIELLDLSLLCCILS